MALQVYIKSHSHRPGQPSGDAFWYSEEPPRVWLLVVDGLGSGAEAAAPAAAAVECVRNWIAHAVVTPAPPDLTSVVTACDRSLRGSRGAAMGLAVFDAAAEAGWYAGVGNIELRLLGRCPAHPVSQSGIVGRGVSRVRVEPFRYCSGDLAIMHSDGLSSRFLVPDQGGVPWNMESLGDQLVRDHGKATDDLTVVLLRQYA